MMKPKVKSDPITAAEARKLAGPTIAESVEAILPAIRKAAEDGKRKLRTGIDYTEDEDLWIYGGYDKTNEWKEAKKILEERGFKVDFYYKESQFVDMYTYITW